MNIAVTIPRIVCERLALDSMQWCAWNTDDPLCRSCADHPAAAVQRFLSIHVEGELDFELFCEGDLAGNGQTSNRMRWAPPDLFLECGECRGSGRYTGLIASELCRACEGHGVIRILY